MTTSGSAEDPRRRLDPWTGEMRRTDQPEPILRISEITPLSFTGIAVLIMVLPGIDNANIIGILASVLAFMIFVPQALRVWRARNDHHALLGVSIVSNIFIVNNALVWFLYAWAVDEFWVGAAGIVNLPLALMIIICIIRSRLIQRRIGVVDEIHSDPNHPSHE